MTVMHGPSGASGPCCPRCALEREWLRVRASPLLARGGFGLYEGLLDGATLQALLSEVGSLRGEAHTVPEGDDPEQVRGGRPARRLVSVDGGPVLAGLYGAPALARFIAGEAGLPVRACGVQATYSLYEGAGAGLGLHRDIAGCDLTLIACLQDNDADHDGGCLEAWPDDLVTPLDALRREGGSPGVRVALQPGQCLLLHGGLVPHRIRAIGADRRRAVALMCFEIAA